MAAKEILRIVVTDSSVVINLHHTSHLGLLYSLPTFRFVVPEEVIAEITEPTQAELLCQLVADGGLEKVSLESPRSLPFLLTCPPVLALESQHASLSPRVADGWSPATRSEYFYGRPKSAWGTRV